MANPAKVNPRFTQFGSAPRDANRNAIMGQNYFATEDATGTPLTSPLAVPAASTTALQVPSAAVQIALISSTDLRVSEDSSMSHYFVLKANTLEKFPCLSPAVDQQLTNTGIIYLKADSSDAVVQFRFDCI